MPDQQPVFNPIVAAQQRYLGLKDMPLEQVYANLQDPAKFRSAFPEYAGLDDATIQRNVARFQPYREPRSDDKSLWEKANTPVIGQDTLLQMSGANRGDIDASLRQGPTNADAERAAGQEAFYKAHPWLAKMRDMTPLGDVMTDPEASRKALLGMSKDTVDTAASFTSPLSLALMGAGAAGRIPQSGNKVLQAVRTAGRAGTAVGGAGFAAKGAYDVADAGLEQTPEAWKQRLLGGAQLAGGAAGVADAKGMASRKAAETVAGSVLKPEPEEVTPSRNAYRGALDEPKAPLRLQNMERFYTQLQDRVGSQMEKQLMETPNIALRRMPEARTMVENMVTEFSQKAERAGEMELAQQANNWFKHLENNNNFLNPRVKDATQLYRDIREFNKRGASNPLSALKLQVGDALSRYVTENVPEIAGLKRQYADASATLEAVQRQISPAKTAQGTMAGLGAAGSLGIEALRMLAGHGSTPEALLAAVLGTGTGALAKSPAARMGLARFINHMAQASGLPSGPATGVAAAASSQSQPRQ